MCPECLVECLTSCNDIQIRLSEWKGETKGEHISNFKTLKKIQRIEYNGTDCEDPDKLEAKLRLYTVQLGGNAFTKYFWKPHSQRHSYRVLRGHSRNGNPHYGTEYRTDRWYTGYASAVIVESFNKPQTAQIISVSGPITQNVKYVVLDGLNICCWANQNKRDLNICILLTLCSELIRQKIPFIVFFDANISHLLKENNYENASEAYKRITAHTSNIFVEVPGRIRADEFILQRANNDNAHIISNDQFRDFENRFPWVSSGDRLIKGAVAGNRLSLPQLNFDLRIMQDPVEAADWLIQVIMNHSN